MGYIGSGIFCFFIFLMILFFFSAVHQNYVGTDAEKSPFYLSVVLSDQNNQRVPQYRAILWRKTVSLGATSVFKIPSAIVTPVGTLFYWLKLKQ